MSGVHRILLSALMIVAIAAGAFVVVGQVQHQNDRAALISAQQAQQQAAADAQHGDHVGLLDRVEPGDRRSIEPNPALEGPAQQQAAAQAQAQAAAQAQAQAAQAQQAAVAVTIYCNESVSSCIHLDRSPAPLPSGGDCTAESDNGTTTTYGCPAAYAAGEPDGSGPGKPTGYYGK